MSRKQELALIVALVVLALASPVVVLAAQDTNPPTSLGGLLGVALAILVPWAGRYIYEGIQKVLGALKKIPSPGQEILVAVALFGINKGLQALGIPLIGDISGVTATLILTVVQTAGAVGLHHLSKPKV